MLRNILSDHPAEEVICSAWSQFNADAGFAVNENELHYLRTVAMALDDDLASLLLLKKLKLARKLPADELPSDLVVMNSFVEFSFGAGPRRFCQLVHWFEAGSHLAVSISSRLGAGLIGLRSGDVVVWPDETGRMLELHIISVGDGDDPRPIAA